MKLPETVSPLTHGILVFAALVVIIAGLKSASNVLAPLLMAVFISIICSAPLYNMQQRGVPTPLALGIILLGVSLTGIALFSLITSSVDEFNRSLPRYKFNLTQLYADVSARLEALNITFPVQELSGQFNPDSFIKLLRFMLNGLSNLLANGMVVFLAVLFILTEVARLPEKLRAALQNPDASIPYLQSFIKKVMHYLALKAATSALTATCVLILLWVLEVDYLFLWAVLAFFLNFIPYVGSILAGLPAVLLALIDHGAGTAFWAVLGYATINIVVGNIIETRWMGDGLNLSSFVVFVSLIFWGWVLGPTGMFLSIPLTMLIMIALESNPASKQLARLMQN